MSISAAEQLLIEMINRTRLDPEGEAARFGIDLNEGLSAGTLDGEARQVLAPNALLHDAADAHGQWMLDVDRFSHTGEGGSSPGDRMEDAGYDFSGRYASGENITYRGSTGSIDLDRMMQEHHHRDLFLSEGHRANMLHDFYSEIGVSQLEGVFTSGTRDFNASMVVENFALSGSTVFLTGVSYTDRDNDNFYSIGEGRAGTAVQAGGASTQTLAAGGYALGLSASRDVAVTLGTVRVSVDLSQGNAKLDLVGVNHVLTSVDTTLSGAAGSLTALGVGDIDLTGHSGADVLVGNKGDNVLAGGAGADTVRYDLDRAQATITAGDDDTVIIVSDMGRDTLTSIETIVFADETLTSATLFNTDPPETVQPYSGEMLTGDGGGNAIYAQGFSAALAPEESAQVFRLYQAALDRIPDTDGHAGWVKTLFENTQSLSAVARGFVASAEFQQTYGALDTGGFVDLLYENVLGRAADASGRAGWIAQIDEAGMSRADAVIGFSESREFIAATAAAATVFTAERTASEWSDDIFRLYTATLGRDPDADGFVDWAEALAGGMDFTQAVTGFVGSTEFRAAYGDLGDGAFIDLLYANVLNRAADAQGRQGWLDVLEGGQSRAQMVEAFVQSAEFRADTAQSVSDWIKGQGVQDIIAGGAGDDVLAGGLWSDVFVFDADADGANQVLDLEAWDMLQFDNFGYSGAAQVRAHFDQHGSDLVFADQGVSVTFQNTDLAAIIDDMLLF
ncbi:DUF4214 domain-containing protein [uncultured Sulfitobacter sp.]|uniref:DUF4214 domain-containing protein n=1 Tax=uncultured Sulfitobacter sp. TaxID=191468 RepID=UPI00263899BD|nr:DUF4214 domain-containing protein [uncultured Sulfitobacter sp.]